jgi:hypothetical protein
MMYDDRLIQATDLSIKRMYAIKEGIRVKKLVGHLRGMWRSSPTSPHERIRKLKALLIQRDRCGNDDEACTPLSVMQLLLNERKVGP